MDLEFYKQKLEAAGVKFAHGLTDAEIGRAQEAYGFLFPPDLREFLRIALPAGEKWPNWRNTDDPYIASMLNWPYDGICFDIEHNVFWWDEWGEKPNMLEEAFRVAKSFVDKAPRLIPVHGHRYLPSLPNLAGNPVFSVYQTDIIYYGCDLEDYFQKEFHFPLEDRNIEPRRIEFWSDVIDWANSEI